MAFIDERGRLFGRFNTVNVAVVAVVILAVALGAYKLLAVRKAGLIETSEILITFEIADVRQPSVDVVKIGDAVAGFESQVPLGSVADKRAEPHREPVATSDGRILMADVPGHFDLYIVVRARAIVGPNAIVVSNREIKIGTELPLTGRLFRYTTTIVGIEESGK